MRSPDDCSLAHPASARHNRLDRCRSRLAHQAGASPAAAPAGCRSPGTRPVPPRCRRAAGQDALPSALRLWLAIADLALWRIGHGCRALLHCVFPRPRASLSGPGGVQESHGCDIHGDGSPPGPAAGRYHKSIVASIPMQHHFYASGVPAVLLGPGGDYVRGWPVNPQETR